MAKVTSKGRVTIPKSVREALGIRPGTELEFRVEGDVLWVRKVRPARAIAPSHDGRGALDLGQPVDSFVEELRNGR